MSIRDRLRRALIGDLTAADLPDAESSRREAQAEQQRREREKQKRERGEQR